jgi:hypothetical protein
VDDLLNEFYETWKRTKRLRQDHQIYGCERRTLRFGLNELDAVARRIEASRRKAAEPVSDDVPGQMYFHEIPVALPAEPTAKAGAA